MIPQANVNLEPSRSCNHWICCIWKGKKIEEPQTVTVEERVHAVYHGTDTEVDIIYTETRTSK